ncbi:MAG: ribokinase [Hyphomicrobiaceae bacterium]|nr:ribokinase [Hyphomicrobiaceae bacterium]
MITVFGSINVDLVTRVARLPKPGETVAGDDYLLVAGGKGANQALAAARAGAAVRMIGAVGADIFAETALAALRAADVDLAGVATVAAPTGLAAITVDARGENVIALAGGANRHASASQLAGIALAPADCLLLQMEVDPVETLKAAAMAKAAGARVILSLAPFTLLPAAAFAGVNLVLVNETEAADLAASLGIAAPDETALLVALAARLGIGVVATLGPRGAIAAFADGQTARADALAITPVDTTAAGDTFAGVLAAGLDAGLAFETALRRAAIAGSLACLKPGAQPSLPTAAEIDAACRDGQ